VRPHAMSTVARTATLAERDRISPSAEEEEFSGESVSG
jgi:hypothetical protein